VKIVTRGTLHRSWSLTRREEHGLRVIQSRVLRRIFGSNRDEVTRGWRKQYIEELLLKVQLE
jgi:hypothetical protein